MCLASKAPAPLTPAPAPFVPLIDRAPAPTLNESSTTSTINQKRKGTKALRIDMAAPQGTSGLNIN